MSKYIWLVSGGVMQIPMAKEIKSRGYNLLITDGNPDAPCKKYADKFIVIDTYDVFGHLNIARTLSEKPIAVLAVAADVGPTVSAIADEFELPGIGYEIATRVRNKASMRAALELSCPVWKEIRYNEMSVESAWKIHCMRSGINPYPCVVKPLEKAGSRGVSLIENPFQLYNAVKKAEESDKNKNTFLIEEYIEPSIEIATDNFIVDGKVVFANAVKRYFSNKVFGLELGHMNPFDLNAEIKRKITFAAKKLGVDWGPFKCDFIYNDEHGWIIAECATRLSGGFDHGFAAPIATGKDITGFMLDMALGDEVSSRSRKLHNTNKKFAFTYAPILKPGKMKSIKMPVPESPDYPWLKHVFTNIKSDGIIQKLENCSQRPLFIITEGNTEYEAIKRAKITERKIEIEYYE